MLNLRFSTKFKKDFKTCLKRGYDMNRLMEIVDTLRIPAKLSSQNKDHELSGNYVGYRECHISPDWLLIYSLTETELDLYRTGTHSDLFG